jgi:hypothetical protein
MRKYHHIGIPTDIEQPGETYLEQYRLFCTDHERSPSVFSGCDSSQSALCLRW